MVSRKLNRSRKQKQNIRQQQRGGDESCATIPNLKTNSCLGEPDVSNYIFPCKNLTSNQFGFKDIGSYKGGSSRKGQRQARKQRGGTEGAYPGVFGERIVTPYDDWTVGLGQNPAVTTQMEADAAGPGQAGGRRQQKKRSNKGQMGGCGACYDGYDDFFRGSNSNRTGGSSLKKRRQQRGGSCHQTVSSCLASNPIAAQATAVYDNVNLAKTAISDGSPTDLPSPSELAWFFRNTYGATPSTNLVSNQKGGKKRNSRQKSKKGRKVQKGGHSDQYFFSFDEKIGGLPRVDHEYDIYPPSLHNVKVSGPAITDVTMVDELNYNLRNRTADVVGALEDSSLTRDSFQIPEDMPMAGAKTTCQTGGKKNYLTRKTRNYLFTQRKQKGGDPAAFPQSFDSAQSVFTEDMTRRTFDCHQPNWCPKCT